MVLRALALACALAGAAAAAETVGDGGERWSGELRFDDAAARWPALDALLRDSARETLDDFALEAEQSAEPDRPWALWIMDEITFAAEGWLSVLRVTSYDTGGAHPNHAVDALIWDLAAAAPAGLDRLIDLSRAGPAITAHLRAEIDRTVHGGAADNFWREDIDAATEAGALTAVSLAPSTEDGRAAGIVVHFSPYAVGPYAAGAPAIPVPWTLFGDALTAEGRALFGGSAAP